MTQVNNTVTLCEPANNLLNAITNYLDSDQKNGQPIRTQIVEAIFLASQNDFWESIVEAIKDLFGISEVYNSWNDALDRLSQYKVHPMPRERAEEILNRCLVFQKVFSTNPNGPRGSLGP